MKWTRKPSIFVNDQALPQSVPVKKHAYGLGLQIATYDGGEYIHHGGRVPPYAALLSLFPGKNLGIFTGSQEMPLNVDQMILHTYIYDLINDKKNAEQRAKNFTKAFRKQESFKMESQKETISKYITELQETPNDKEPRNDEWIGEYGNGASGNFEIVEKWNDDTNTTELYIIYGRFAHGWLEHVGVETFRIVPTTDMVQDYYILTGNKESINFITRVNNDTLQMFILFQGMEIDYGKFTLGITLDKLPPIPWSPESCGSK